MSDELYTLTAKLTEIAEQNPDKVAVQLKTANGYEQYTYQQFYQISQAIAQSLSALGIKKGEKVAIVLENRPEWGFIYFAIIFCGAIAIPIDPQASQADIEYFISQSQTKLVFVAQQFLSIFNNLDIAHLRNYVVLDFEKNLSAKLDNKKLTEKIIPYTELLAPEMQQKLPAIGLDDLASILYTSGTTGKPKGVMLSHRNFYANFHSAYQLGLIKSNDNVLSMLPLHHSFPFMVTLLIPLFSQNCITYIYDIKPEVLLSVLYEADITIVVLVPQILNMIRERIDKEINKLLLPVRWSFWGVIYASWMIRKLSMLNLTKLFLRKIHSVFGAKLRFFVCGGAELNYDTARVFAELGFTVLQGYGLTETSPIATFNSSGINRLNSVGKQIPDVDIKIVAMNAQNIGEVAIKGPNVMLGYYNDKKATRRAIKDGWFYSGDLGYVDKQGYLYLTGRKNELIVMRSGKNITPDEVEAHYLQSPYIKELCVMSLEEKLVAIVVPDLNYFCQKEIVDLYGTIKWDLENLSKNYPAYKRIMGFVISKHDLPRTRLGKLKRYLIKDKYLPEFTSDEAQVEQDVVISDADLKIYASETTKSILSTLADELSLSKPIQLTDNLEIDLGCDSLRRIEVLFALEKALHITIPSAVIAKVFTVRELVLALEKLMGKQQPIITRAVEKTSGDNLWSRILQIEPGEQLLKSIVLHPGWCARLSSRIITSFLGLIFKIIFRFTVVGKENLPKNEPVILCINHASYLDGFLIGAALPDWLMQATFLIASNIIFGRPIIGYFVKSLKIIPINQVARLVETMQVSAYVLRHGKSLAFFPAGARSIDGEVQVFKKGVGILAKELNLRLLPVYIKGSFAALPRGCYLPKPHKITVTFGKPCATETLKKRGMKLGAKDDYQAITMAVREEVVKLGD